MITISCLSFPHVTGVHYFRCMQPLLFLQKNYPDKIRIVSGNDKTIMDAVGESDIYFHESPGLAIARLMPDFIREHFPKVKIVFDYDDAPVKYITPEYPSYADFGLTEAEVNLGSLVAKNGKKIEFKRSWKRGNVIDGRRFDPGISLGNVLGVNELRDKADFITTTTEKLASEIRPSVKVPVEVLPNFIEPALYEKVADPDKKEIRIGWVIGHSHYADLIDLLPCIIDLLNERKNVKVYIMSQYNDLMINLVKNVNVPADRLIVFPATGILNGYFDVLKHMDLDIGLMHLKNNDTYNQCKSPLKFLEMTACGAAVCAPDTLYHDYISDGVSGLLYANKNEFNKLVRKLIDNAELRETLKAGAVRACEQFTASVVAPKYLKFFESVMVKK